MRVMKNQASRLVLLTICLMYLIFYVDRVNISTAAPIMQKDLGLTATQLGIAFSAFAYPYAFFQIAGGWLGDRMGPRLTLFLCALLVAASTVWTGMVGGIGGAVRIPACARHRRGTGVSDRDARAVELDAPGPARLCPRHHPCILAISAMQRRRH